MIERQHGKLIFMCDECSDESESFDSFDEGLAEIKREGWLITKDSDGEWMHVCPDCAQ